MSTLCLWFCSCARKLAIINLFLAPSDCNKRSIIILYIYNYSRACWNVNTLGFTWFRRADICFQIIWEKLNFTPHSFVFTDVSYRDRIWKDIYWSRLHLKSLCFRFFSRIFQFQPIRQTFCFRSIQWLSFRSRKSEQLHRLQIDQSYKLHIWSASIRPIHSEQ